MKKIIRYKSLILIGLFFMILTPIKVSSSTIYNPTTDITTNLGHNIVMHQTKGSFIGSQSISYVTFNPKTTKTIKLIPWAVLNPSTETNTRKSVLNIAKDYEAKNPNSKVLLGINADYFPFVGPNENPFSAQVIEGDLHQGNAFNQSGYIANVLGIMPDGTLQNSYQVKASIPNYLDIFDETGNIIFSTEVAINKEPSKGNTSAYFGVDFQSQINSDKDIFLIENPSFIRNDHRFIRGIITSQGKTIKPTLRTVAIKSDNNYVNEMLKVGVEVRITKRLTNGLENATSAIGFWGHPLQNGKVVSYGLYPNGVGGPVDQNVIRHAHPRTLMGVKSDGSVIMAVVEGRATDKTGLTGIGSGEFLQQFGCVDGYMFDGGGSSTLVARVDGTLKQIVTGTTGTREVVNALLLVEQEIDLIELNATFEDIGVDSFTIKVNPTAESGKTITKIEAIVNTTSYLLTNNECKVMGVRANSSNVVKFKVTYLENSQEKSFVTLKTLIVLTSSKPPVVTVEDVKIEATQVTFKVNLQDNGSSISEAYFALNGEKQTLVPGLNEFVFTGLNAGANQTYTAIIRYIDPETGAKFYTIPNVIIKTLEMPITNGCSSASNFLINLMSVLSLGAIVLKRKSNR